jgi:hypothetical protein
MKSKIKALYIGFNRTYTNPTFDVQIRIFASILDLTFYGPGFSSDAELSLGIDNFERNIDYDLLITDTYVFEYDRIQKRSKPFAGDYIRFTREQYLDYAENYNRFFIQFPNSKILIANWDLFNIESSMIDRLIKSKTFVLDPGISSSASIQELQDTYGAKVKGTDNWFNFVKSNSELIISVPHTIGMEEFDFTPLDKRKNLFSVVGAPYPERKQAKMLLENPQKINLFLLRIQYSILSRIKNTLTLSDLNKIRDRYFNTCINSKFCYVSGGPWQSPVRKYFEVPAKGCVPIGWPCVGFKNFGFIDGENFLVAKNNKEILQLIHSIDISELQKIVTQSRGLILKSHSSYARTSQLSSSLNLIFNGSFNGSYWENGEYINR